MTLQREVSCFGLIVQKYVILGSYSVSIECNSISPTRPVDSEEQQSRSGSNKGTFGFCNASSFARALGFLM